MIRLTVIAILICSSNCFSQSGGPNWSWAITNTGLGEEFATTMTTHVNGYSYVAGYFEGNSLELDGITLNKVGERDIFIAKIDQFGNTIWAKSAGGSLFDYPSDITTDFNGNVYLAGSFTSPTISFGTTNLIADSTSNGFVVKYTSLGDVEWAKKIGTNANGVAVNSQNRVYIVGTYAAATLTFGTSTIANGGENDVFLADIGSTGLEYGVIGFGGQYNQLGQKLSVDANDNVYIIGIFTQGDFSIDSTVLSHSGEEDVYIIKLNNDMNVSWAKSFGSIDSEWIRNCTVDNAGYLYVVGEFRGNPTIDSTLLINEGQIDFYVTKWDENGNLMWATSAGTFSYDYVDGVVTDAENNVYIAGVYSMDLYIDSLFLPSGSYYNNYVVKYSSEGVPIWAKKATANFTGDLSIDPAGNLYVCGTYREDSAIFDLQTVYNSNLDWNDANIFVSKIGSEPLGNSKYNNDEDQLLSLYPNPNSGKFHLEYPNLIHDDDPQIHVFDILGNQIYPTVNKSQFYAVDLSTYPPGVYLIRYESEHLTKSLRVIITAE